MDATQTTSSHTIARTFIAQTVSDAAGYVPRDRHFVICECGARFSAYTATGAKGSHARHAKH